MKIMLIIQSCTKNLTCLAPSTSKYTGTEARVTSSILTVTVDTSRVIETRLTGTYVT